MNEDLPAPWPDVLASLRSISEANSHVLDIVNLLRNRYDAEIAELRDDIRELRELAAR